ncbi:hypothetical protein [Bradyrhizobium lablabi]|uniref:phage fiber-tail adaptor protein n=1 Tax=Bradyrhizobium lablabi TaxID=722472 RepID=UPI001BAC6214|nr:hypothetical protein [Bradyrhizobium lablabi]MBR0693669.1 hypothetical protein [Bradyrhizobium lablabi]
MLTWPPKDPGEVLDYDINWAPRLGSDTIVTSDWVTQPGITLTINSKSFTSQLTKVWLSGGTIGETYVLKNTVTTVAGDTVIESVSILIRAK